MLTEWCWSEGAMQKVGDISLALQNRIPQVALPAAVVEVSMAGAIVTFDAITMTERGYSDCRHSLEA